MCNCIGSLDLFCFPKVDSLVFSRFPSVSTHSHRGDLWSPSLRLSQECHPSVMPPLRTPYSFSPSNRCRGREFPRNPFSFVDSEDPFRSQGPLAPGGPWPSPSGDLWVPTRLSSDRPSGSPLTVSTRGRCHETVISVSRRKRRRRVGKEPKRTGWFRHQP